MAVNPVLSQGRVDTSTPGDREVKMSQYGGHFRVVQIQGLDRTEGDSIVLHVKQNADISSNACWFAAGTKTNAVSS